MVGGSDASTATVRVGEESPSDEAGPGSIDGDISVSVDDRQEKLEMIILFQASSLAAFSASSWVPNTDLQGFSAGAESCMHM